MLRQAYDATWGRAFAKVYDRALDASEKAGLRDTLATIGASPLEVERSVRGRIPKAAPLVRPLLSGTATLAAGESTTGGVT